MLNSNYQHLIEHIPFLASLPREEAMELVTSLDTVSFPPDWVFLREGEAGTELYIVLSGQVDIVKALGTRNERLLGTHSTGTVIGEMSLLDPNEPRSASARTRTAAEILVMTRSHFETLLARYPSFSLNLLRSLSTRLRLADESTIRDLRRKNWELDKANADLKTAQQQIIQQELLAYELRSAAQLQQRMLPSTLPQVTGVEIGATMISARHVGGDFYDIIQLDKDRLAVVVGDVAGKGIPAAIYMALVCTLVRAAARTVAIPEEVLRTVNQELDEREMDGMFVTVLYGELNVTTREFTYVRAGHEHPLIWNEVGQMIEPASGKSVALGLLSTPRLDVRTIRLASGSMVLLTTDGVTEAMDSNHGMFGRERLCNAALANALLPPQTLCQVIVRQVMQHQGDVPQSDDITLLALRLT